MRKPTQKISPFLWFDHQAEDAVNFYVSIFKFTEAISFVVNCETQAEVDHFWEKLSGGGQEVQCGWLKDRFGVSWQVVPTVLGEMLQDKDREKSRRVMAAILKMKKINIEAIKKAYEGRFDSASGGGQ